MGAYLADAGIRVLFVDQDEEHVNAMNDTGLSITGPVREFTSAVTAVTPAGMSGQHRLVLLAVKSQHTRTAVRQLAPFLAPDGLVVSAQNGLNEPEIAEVVGQERTVGAFVNFGADLVAPGRILYGGRGAVYAGELDGRLTDRVTQLHELLQKFEPDTVLTDNINGYLWAKLAYGAMLFATALTNASIADVLAEPRYNAYFVLLAQEVLGIADLEGIRPEAFDGFNPEDFADPDRQAGAILQPMVDFNRRSAKTHSGIWRDLAVRKRRTEVDAQLVPIVTTAARHGRLAPLSARLVELIHGIEEGHLEQSWATLDLALEALSVRK